jgi:hypothetical protein
MTTYTHKKTAILERIVPININDYIRQGIFELKRKGYCFNLGHPLEAERLKELLNDSKNTTFKSVRDPADGFCYWHEQKVSFIRSNLGNSKGAIFYFICNGCNQRVKFLYEYNYCYSPLCRECCHLGYKYPNRKARDLSRILRKPYLHSEDKHWIIKRAGITKEDIPEDLERENNGTEIATEQPKAWQDKKEMPLNKPVQPPKPLAQIIKRKPSTNFGYGEEYI